MDIFMEEAWSMKLLAWRKISIVLCLPMLDILFYVLCTLVILL